MIKERPKHLVISVLIIIVLFITALINIWIGGEKKTKMTIRVEGFEIDYNLTGEKITKENLDAIELGSSIHEIRNELGEPDAWIGSGMLRPIYFLEDKKVVVFHFRYPAVCEDLKQIVIVNKNGECQIMKEK